MFRFRRHLFGSVPLLAVAAALACGGESLVVPPTTGTVRVTTATSGAEPDADGYLVQMDGGAEQSIGASASLQIEAVNPGTHAVQLAEVAANCTVGGENPRTVSITAGETATVAFEVTCSATTGSLQVSSSTSGPSTDPDGYGVNVDGTDRGFLTATGNLTVDGLAAGDHLIGLSGVAGNCQVQGNNPRTATITAGASASMDFAITCVAPPANAGSLHITTATTGADLDADGYAFAVDDGSTQTIGINTSAPPVTNIAAGPHTVRLSGVAANCSVADGSSRTVAVTAGGTTEVTFAVTCAATTGSIKVTTATTGSNPDNGYSVKVDQGTTQSIGGNGTFTFNGIAPGARVVALSGLATNCILAGENPRQVTVTVSQTASVDFVITCNASAQARIAFVSDNPGNVRDVFTVNPDGTDRSRLTDGLAGAARTPEWSPDRSKIVFEGGTLGGEIYVINADGTGLKNLTNTPPGIGLGRERETNPTWSPDGKRVLFVRAREISEDTEESDFWTMNSDGGDQVQITHTGTEALNGEYDWSPDGTRILFARNDRIYVMAADGANPTALTEDAVSHAPSWSPDGRRIAFLRTDGGVEVWAMNSDGSAETQLTHQPGDLKSYPRWSPDGTRIAYMFAASTGSADIWTVNASGGGEFNVTRTGLDNTQPAWSPNGRQIAFVSGYQLGANPVVRVINADGTGLRPDVSGRQGYDPAW